MSTLGFIEYENASPAVRAVYDDIKATRKIDKVTNFWKALAHDPVRLKRTWEDTKKPDKKHVLQATMYARMVGSEQIRFLYLNKDTGELREMLVRLDRKVWHSIADRLESVIEIVKDGRLPPQIESSECDECPFLEKCKRRRHHHG